MGGFTLSPVVSAFTGLARRRELLGLAAIVLPLALASQQAQAITLNTFTTPGLGAILSAQARERLDGRWR